MTQHNTEHIDDGFLKKMVQQTPKEMPSADFTSRVMNQIPKHAQVETVEKTTFKLWHWALVAAGLTGIVYFIITFDLNSIFRKMSADNSDEGINYVNIFKSIINIFNEGFSSFQVTSITAVIILSGVLLYFGDKFLKHWASTKVSIV
nr:hypothetical protein [Bacteroidota bacterium]